MRSGALRSALDDEDVKGGGWWRHLGHSRGTPTEHGHQGVVSGLNWASGTDWALLGCSKGGQGGPRQQEGTNLGNLGTPSVAAATGPERQLESTVSLPCVSFNVATARHVLAPLIPTRVVADGFTSS
jgi:hypothetical protein